MISIIIYQATDSWQLGIIFLDVILFAVGIVIQHKFPLKDKIVNRCTFCLMPILWVINGIYRRSKVPTQSNYILACITLGCVEFWLGILTCSIFQSIKKNRKNKN